nr:PREDICTED: uncharacterized protein LOC109034597 [Bemisia tabaci]XP_018903381.1 PREDICTED: uncharacterized protein LOC109034597 [Bemisia tabaci]
MSGKSEISMRLNIIILLYLMIISYAEAQTETMRGVSCVNKSNELTASRIIPKYIPEPLPGALFVDYLTYAARCGMEPNPSLLEVLDKPNFYFIPDPKIDYYALFMFDPDAPAPEAPILSPILHYASCNILKNKTDTGITLADYLLPTPLSVAPHRYITFVFSQKDILPVEICFQGRYSLKRFFFPLKKTIAELNLTYYGVQFYNVGLT